MKKLINWCLNIYKKHKEIINYLICGGIATALNVVTFIVFNILLGKDLYKVSNAISIIVAVLFQYFSNKFFVFERKEQTKKEVWIEFWKFMSARAVTALIDMGIMYIGISLLLFNEYVVKIFTQIVIIILNYIFSKFLVFTTKAKNNLDLKRENAS